MSEVLLLTAIVFVLSKPAELQSVPFASTSSQLQYYDSSNYSTETNSKLDVSSEDNSTHVRSQGMPHDLHHWLNYRESEKLLTLEGGEDSLPVDCCPSIMEMVEPEGGINQDNMYVELFREGENRQRFFEMSCRPDVLEKPCRFMEKKFHNRSKCVQKYSYSYAIVRDPSTMYEMAKHQKQFSNSFFSGERNGQWMLDYIKIRSGCSCEIQPQKKFGKKSSKGSKKKRTLL